MLPGDITCLNKHSPKKKPYLTICSSSMPYQWNPTREALNVHKCSFWKVILQATLSYYSLVEGSKSIVCIEFGSIKFIWSDYWVRLFYVNGMPGYSKFSYFRQVISEMKQFKRWPNTWLVFVLNSHSVKLIVCRQLFYDKVRGNYLKTKQNKNRNIQMLASSSTE